MGLDMYLYKLRKMKNKNFEQTMNLVRKSWDEELSDEEKGEIQPYLQKNKVGDYEYDSLLYIVADWRKVNFIHKWFVDNIQNEEDDCGYYLVNKRDIEYLLETCKDVYSSLKDKELVEETRVNEYNNQEYTIKVFANKDLELAKELLPTQEGFFFGGTEYDKYYIMDLQETIKMLQNVLVNFDFENNYLLYHSSW